MSTASVRFIAIPNPKEEGRPDALPWKKLEAL
jgi:hypothetical protein